MNKENHATTPAERTESVMDSEGLCPEAFGTSCAMIRHDYCCTQFHNQHGYPVDLRVAIVMVRDSRATTIIHPISITRRTTRLPMAAHCTG
jgi:hypothetical protein